jgi:rubrerythrin
MITLQPDFITAFHKALAVPAWISALERFTTERIQASGSYQTTNGTGTVRALYTDERYLGPNSAVRYRLEIHVDVDREEPTRLRDSFSVAVDFDPQSGRFSVFGVEQVSTLETRARYKETMRRAKEEWIASFEALESREEFERWKCPECSGGLRPRFYPEGRSWSYSCAQDLTHLASSWIGVRLEPGGWWTDHVADRTCPRCNSSDYVAGLLYGLIMMEVDGDIWELGGCSVNPENRYLWHCRKCNVNFARGAKEQSPESRETP